jgi:hypothetical protein
MRNDATDEVVEQDGWTSGDDTAPSGATRTLREAIASSPWFAIAVMVHVVLIAVASIVYVAQRHAVENEPPIEISRRPPVVVPEPLPLEPLPLERGGVPIFDDDKADDPNLHMPENFVPDAKPGLKGDPNDFTEIGDDPGTENPNPDSKLDALPGEPGGTPIGVGSVGHRGLAPSAWSTRDLGLNGRGHNHRGEGGENGPVHRHSDIPDGVPIAALTWLAKHQSADGRWDADGFDAQCKSGQTCSGKGDALNDVGLTGLALLCFLGAGETNLSGLHQRTVRNGILFLKSVQDDDGCFGTRTGKAFQYSHACAALAMAEAYGMTQMPVLQKPAQRGLDFVMKSRNPYKAWRYGVADGDNDVSVTGWMVMALKSGRMAGLAVEESALRDAAAFVDELTDPNCGRTGYQQRGTPPARNVDQLAKFPPEKSESLTAVGMLVRIFADHTGAEDKAIDRGADLLAALPPKWDESSGQVDLYYWYYGSLAMHQVGDRRWNKWNDALKTALIDHQHTDATKCDFGSWDPVDPWSQEGGRVYATAINCLTSEVYYRYPRVFGTKRTGDAARPAAK